MFRTKINSSCSEKLMDILRNEVIRNEGVVEKKIANNRFHFVSVIKYSSLSVIEKEYFFIDGLLESTQDECIIKSSIRGNNTFGILSIVLPIFMLPSIAIAIFVDRSNSLFAILGYTLVAIVCIIICRYKTMQFQNIGIKYWKKVLNDVKQTTEQMTV